MRIHCEGLSARHLAASQRGGLALQDLNLTLAAGEQVAIIGPSGAGKTTLLHLLACALRPAAGTLRLDECDPWALDAGGLRRLRGDLFLAPHVPPLPPRQRVVTAVLAGRLPHQGLVASLRSLFHPTDLDAVDAALARFDVADKLFARVDRLSGGERQRVGLARALLSQARLFLVDEPLSALDPSRAAQAVATLTQVARERSATLVATLHDVAMALQHFPRIVGLRDGRLAFDLPSAQVDDTLLQSLYAQEGAAPLAAGDELAVAAAPARPAAMHCR